LAAELALDLVRGPDAEAVPLLAACWLAEGHTEPEVAALAGLTGDDTFEVRDALRAAVDAMGIGVPAEAEAVRVLFRDLARRCLDGEVSERALASQVWRIYVASDYAEQTIQQPLGPIGFLDDQWGQGWGRTDLELEAEARSACKAQLGQPEA